MVAAGQVIVLATAATAAVSQVVLVLLAVTLAVVVPHKHRVAHAIRVEMQGNSVALHPTPAIMAVAAVAAGTAAVLEKAAVPIQVPAAALDSYGRDRMKFPHPMLFRPVISSPMLPLSQATLHSPHLTAAQKPDTLAMAMHV